MLPEHDVVVFDEAHELEEVMTASLGVEVTAGRVRALVTTARGLVDERDRDLLETLGDLGEQLGDLVIDRIGTRVLDDRGRLSDEDRSLSDVLVRAADVSRRVTDALRRSGGQGSLLEGGEADPDRGTRKTRTVQAAAHLAEDLHRLVSRTDAHVAWVDGTRRNARLRLSPIDVGPALAGLLWGEVTSVLTSATIPPRLVERVGLESFATEELNVGSPFDYRAHALLYVARHLPDRRAEGAEETLHEELGRLIGVAGGRTLALFTSRRATEAAAEALVPELPYTVLIQGDLPKARLLEEFAEDETSCLLATLGFWQGVDIAGRALSLVTIDRLALPPPRRPLAPGPAGPGRRARLPAGRPAPGGDDAGAGCGPAHPHGGGPGRGGGARPAPGHGVVPRGAAVDAAAHAALGRPRRGRGVPAAGARQGRWLVAAHADVEITR